MSSKTHSTPARRNRKWIADEIERLNPEEDYAEIWRLTTNYYVNDFVMNLVYTLGIPSFTQYPEGSAIMAVTTKKAMKAPHEAPRRFVWKPTATIGGGRSAVWACGQVAERLVHMPMRPCSA